MMLSRHRSAALATTLITACGGATPAETSSAPAEAPPEASETACRRGAEGGDGRGCQRMAGGRDGRGRGRGGGGHGGGGHGGGHGGGGHGGGGHGGGGHGGGRGRGRGAGPPTAAQRADFHALLDRHGEVTRRVELRSWGVESWTTSEDPEVAAVLVRHVEGMRDHMAAGGRVRMWDPLFRALVEGYDDITLEVVRVEGGVHVLHRGATPEAVALLHAHARTVSGFVERGHREAGREHPVP
jgi:hypothetical protein